MVLNDSMSSFQTSIVFLSVAGEEQKNGVFLIESTNDNFLVCLQIIFFPTNQQKKILNLVLQRKQSAQTKIIILL